MRSVSGGESARALLVAAWTDDSLELWRVEARSGAPPERQRVDAPFADARDRMCLRLRMTSADQGWLRTRIDRHRVFARVVDGGRRVEPCPPAPASSDIDLNACKIHGGDKVTVIERAPAGAPAARDSFGSRVHCFSEGRWATWDSPPSVVIHDLSFTPDGGVWLAPATHDASALPPALWFRSSSDAEPERVPVTFDVETRLRLAASRLVGAQGFEEFRRIEAESEAWIAFADSPDLWDSPATFAVVRRRDGLFSAHRFELGVGFASTPSRGILVAPKGDVTSIDSNGRLHRHG